MRMPLRTLGILLTLTILLAAMILWVFSLFRGNSAANPLQELIRPAVPLEEPVTKEVAADRGWQNTGILVRSGETIRLHYLSGEIHDGETVIRGPAGAGWACGDSSCCEPMPFDGRDALIGRVGDEFFLIGDTSEITVPSEGELQLRINDCDAGLSDNAGSLLVKISPGE